MCIMARKPLSIERQQDAVRLRSAWDGFKEDARIKGKKVTQEDVSEACGWGTQGAFSAYLNGRTPLNLDALIKLSNYLGKNPADISPELAAGIESVSLSFTEPLKKNEYDLKDDAIKISPLRFRYSHEIKDTVRIPVHKNVRASCGAGIENFLEEITDYVEIDPAFLKMVGIKTKPEKLRLIYSIEWSMWPTVAPDTPIFVDISHVDTSAMVSGDVYVFLHNGVLRMKRVFVSYGNEKTIRLQSDNPDKNKFPDEIITKDQLNELSFVGRMELALVKG